MNRDSFIKIILVLLAVVILAQIAMGGTVVWVANRSIDDRNRLEQIAQEADQRSDLAYRANCVEFYTAQDRAATTSEILEDQPDAELIFGIPRNLIERGLARDEQIVEDLGFLQCPPNPDR